MTSLDQNSPISIPRPDPGWVAIVEYDPETGAIGITPVRRKSLPRSLLVVMNDARTSFRESLAQEANR